MKPFLFAAAIAVVLSVFCTSFSSVTSPAPISTSVAAPSLLKDNTHYYWYLNNGDVYDGWYTIADEISRLSTMYGVYVDMSPYNGGTLLSRGFVLYGSPHLIWASVYCYGHF